MRKFIYILFVAFLLVSCGESHHQVTGSVEYRFDGDSIMYTIPFQCDYHRNSNCKDMGLTPMVSLDENGSVLNLYIVTNSTVYGFFGPYNLVNAPGKVIVYDNLSYKYTVE